MVSLNRKLNVIILAAGRGTRMYSSLPKVLHPLGGKAMVQHVIDAAIKLGAAQIYLVYGHGGELLQQCLFEQKYVLNWVFQAEQCGTGQAVQQTIPLLKDNEEVLILYGDVPLITVDTLERLLISRPDGGIGLLTVTLLNPNGYGRVLRDNGQVIGIVEHKDANRNQRCINEINTGILVARISDLKHWLGQLINDNIQKEFYLTDIVALAWKEGHKISTVHPARPSEVEGVNNRLQLVRLERIYQKEQAERLLLAGVMLADPARFDLRGELQHGEDVFIDINVVCEGKVTIGHRVMIGIGCILKNTIVGDDVVISPYTIIEGAHLVAKNTVGPFAHLRFGSELKEGAHVGNFVEMKKVRFGKGSKVGHLSYLGDADIGSGVNIGAGSIICNYDGRNKHHTIIGNDVFVGSDSQLVAPVVIGNGATIGAGTTVTQDVLAGETIISRVRQFPITNWKRSIKKT